MTHDVDKDVTQEYGLRIDCERNGCVEPHGDNGLVLPRGMKSEPIERVNGHAVTFVVRDVTRSPWRDLTRDILPGSEATMPSAEEDEGRDGVEVVEWAVQYRPGAPLTERPPFLHEETPLWTEETARTEVKRLPEAAVFSRTRITFPDVVSDWASVTPPGEGDGS